MRWLREEEKKEVSLAVQVSSVLGEEARLRGPEGGSARVWVHSGGATQPCEESSLGRFLLCMTGGRKHKG